MEFVALEKFLEAKVHAELALSRARQIRDDIEMFKLNLAENRRMLALDFAGYCNVYGDSAWTEIQAQDNWSQFREIRTAKVQFYRSSIANSARRLSDILGLLGILLAMLPELDDSTPREYRTVHEDTMKMYNQTRTIFAALAPPFEV